MHAGGKKPRMKLRSEVLMEHLMYSCLADMKFLKKWIILFFILDLILINKNEFNQLETFSSMLFWL